MARTDPQVNFRMPQELRDMLESAAKASNRTLTAEIVSRLQESFADPDALVISDDMNRLTSRESLDEFYELLHSVRAEIARLKELQEHAQSSRATKK